MPKNLFTRYIWIIDTIKRYGKITREELNRLWMLSPYGNGEPLARRTFYNYRAAIEDLFKISIECDSSTFEYYIDEPDNQSQSVTDWMLNSAAMSDLLTDARDISSRIFLEDIPSSRTHLSTIIKAIKASNPVKFTYQPFNRLNATHGIVLEPYFLKLFKQRWYVTGYVSSDDKIKTYALDRMHNVKALREQFVMPEDFEPSEFIRDAFGIVFSQGEVKQVAIKTDSRQAKYFRALPLHHSQSEMLHDAYSIFYYKLKLTPDFVQELLSYGPRITVISPPELRAMMVENISESLNNYE
ncbi:MAG: WYL domain-containing protein [Muribaculaceae bacterium]|nr:WYL domain-containing protein [Muribaculaceae bacterium]